jgi:NAD(P)-dependent dehydrogenase (short-subunit alcohol dehydrogenase family)
MNRFEHATVVIAGASSGIGLATAFAFACAGAKLVLGARRGDQLRRAAALCHELGGRAVPFELDVGDATQVQRLTDAAVESFGRVDIWFNNAGIGVVGPFETVPLDAHVRVIETNLLGVIHGSHAAVRQFMAQDRRGILINMSSLGGVFPAPFATSYTASKFAIAGFTDALRAELSDRSRIEVCGVYPSFVDTPAIGYAGNYSGHDLTGFRPGLDPEDVAARILDLARHPRRALFVGGPPLPRLTAAMTPNVLLRRAARLARRSIEEAPPAEPTLGNLQAPPPVQASVHGHWHNGPPAERDRWGVAATGVVALAAALVVGLGARAALSRR